jgi:carboxyl-terminal processing protease
MAIDPALPSPLPVTAEPAPPDDAAPPPDAAPAEDPAAAASPPAPLASIVRPARRHSGIVLVAVALVSVLAGSALFVSGYSLGRESALTPGTPADEAARFQPFWDTYRAVTERYAGGSVDRKAIVEGAIKGMIGALNDPYSQYLSSDEFKSTLRTISGEFEGIGATIGTTDSKGNTSACTTLAPDCRLVVVKPQSGSPAAVAGLLPGDVIAAIDGSTVDGLSVDAARDRVRGPRDTEVRLTIVRGNARPTEVQIVRALIVQDEVQTQVLAGGHVGYIRLSGFSDNSAAEFDRAVAADVAAGRRELIVDLRGNPGGFVTAARDIASQFLANGTVFWQEDAQGNLTETMAKPGGVATDPSIRLVVLVDGGSASASEIVAGALHDRGRATLVGTKTFGKGTVQQWTQLEDDSGGFRLTIAKWLTPNKTWIHGVGITPDVVVTATPAKPGEDPVLDAGLRALGEAATGVVSRAAA